MTPQLNNTTLPRRPSRSPRAAALWLGLERLEDRRLLSAIFPTPAAQYLVEVINRDRADPLAAATRYGVGLNEGPPKDFITHQPIVITSTPKQPLAFNLNLNDAAQKHSQWMIDDDNFTHFEVDAQGTPIPGFNRPEHRAITAGYNTPNGLPGFENIAAQGQSGALPLIASVDHENSALFIDSNTDGRGHRINIMNDGLTEVGIGLAVGPLTYHTNMGDRAFNSLLLTEDFAANSGPFLTGVVYTDNNANNFYTPGEGKGGVTITATPVGGGQPLITQTWDAGGYTLKIPSGFYNITAVGEGFAEMHADNVHVEGLNVKIDFIKGPPPPAPAINVRGGTAIITNGDATPAGADGTDFGAVAVDGGAVIHNFTIRNTGAAALNLTGDPRITVTGANAGDFTVVTQPGSSTIAPGGSATFQVRFDPSALGSRTATVTIDNDDVDNSPYIFTLQGNGSAADLVGQFTNIVIPAVLTPGAKIKAALKVTNQGEVAATGPLTIKFYASTDPTLQSEGPNADALVGEITVAAAKILAGGFKVFNLNTTLGNVPPGNYFLLADVDVLHEIGEIDDGNNVAVSDQARAVVWQFGRVGSQAGVSLQLADADGTLVKYTLKGAGTGTVISNGDDPPDLVIDDADATTAVTITTTKPKGSAADAETSLHDITIHGSAKSLTAKGVSITGDAHITGIIGAFTVNDFTELGGVQHTLAIDGAPLKPADAAVLVFDQVAELTIDSPQLPIKSFTAASWTDRDLVRDVVTAPWAAAVTIKGDKKRAIAGVFEADLLLTSVSIKAALGKLTVADAVSGSRIEAAGNIGAVTVGALLDSEVRAGVTGAAGLPDASDLGSMTLAGLTVKGLAPGTATFMNSVVAAGVIAKVSLHDVRVDNGGELFGFVTRKLKSIKRLDAPASISLPASGVAGDADLDPNDDFVIRVVL